MPGSLSTCTLIHLSSQVLKLSAASALDAVLTSDHDIGIQMMHIGKELLFSCNDGVWQLVCCTEVCGCSLT